MRVPIEWLSLYCDPGLSTSQLEERLTMTGTTIYNTTEISSVFHIHCG